MTRLPSSLVQVGRGLRMPYPIQHLAGLAVFQITISAGAQ